MTLSQAVKHESTAMHKLAVRARQRDLGLLTPEREGKRRRECTPERDWMPLRERERDRGQKRDREWELEERDRERKRNRHFEPNRERGGDLNEPPPRWAQNAERRAHYNPYSSTRLSFISPPRYSFRRRDADAGNYSPRSTHSAESNCSAESVHSADSFRPGSPRDRAETQRMVLDSRAGTSFAPRAGVSLASPAGASQSQPTTVLRTNPTAVVRANPATVLRGHPPSALKSTPPTVLQKNPTTVLRANPAAVLKTNVLTGAPVVITSGGLSFVGNGHGAPAAQPRASRRQRTKRKNGAQTQENISQTRGSVAQTPANMSQTPSNILPRTPANMSQTPANTLSQTQANIPQTQGSRGANQRKHGADSG
ncbi:hypothetical protein BJ138DRAFT_84973 [Hygrophoropsis aurantiaca]|uniref:Uncharacterized protein n=1 Tax=Hygrophoropsis aurantiaca TaxID=72124 RepID=A0ACB7ZSU1_9AGAM|nr:hypothetical protein BJ138DRAFT_84973 [Hygrophoropsis aurantiaca]